MRFAERSLGADFCQSLLSIHPVLQKIKLMYGMENCLYSKNMNVLHDTEDTLQIPKPHMIEKVLRLEFYDRLVEHLLYRYNIRE
jgi:hypothetical protein